MGYCTTHRSSAATDISPLPHTPFLRVVWSPPPPSSPYRWLELSGVSWCYRHNVLTIWNPIFNPSHGLDPSSETFKLLAPLRANRTQKCKVSYANGRSLFSAINAMSRNVGTQRGARGGDRLSGPDGGALKGGGRGAEPCEKIARRRRKFFGVLTLFHRFICGFSA